MEAVFKVDASKQYKQGTSLNVVSDGTFGMYKVKFSSKGNVPDMLSGSYSSADLAKKAILRFLAFRDAVMDTKERRDDVRAGKAKHAAKQIEVAEAV